MPSIISGQVGPQIVKDGVKGVSFRQARSGELCVGETHSRYQEPTSRSNVFTIESLVGGESLNASNASTVANTATPIVGFLNPINSGKNCVILFTYYGIESTNVTTPVNPGIPIYQVTQPSIALASTTFSGPSPFNNLTQQGGASISTPGRGSGSVCICAQNAAYSGNTSTWTMFRPMVIPGPLTSTLPNATAQVIVSGMEDVGGSIIIQPGVAFGIFVLASGTNINIFGAITWEEVSP